MRLIALLFSLVMFGSCATKENRSSRLFELIDSNYSNIDFSNKVENTNNFNFLEYLYFYNGGGVAIGDVNNDGLPDIYFTANQNANKLYLNEGNFKFKDISQSAKVEGTGSWATGVTMADINADGLLDIYVCYVDGYKGLTGHNELYINNGDLTFTESAAEYGLDFSGFSTQAVFFDYDNDTDLDVYLLNHSVHSVGSYGDATLRNRSDTVSGDRLFQSQLAQGGNVFRDVTHQAQIYTSKIGYGLGVSVADINEDGWQDIYVSNDFHENDYLYFNNRDGTFTESINETMGHSSRYSMGNDIGDLNNDGLLDIVTTDMLPENPSILMKSGAEDKLEVSEIKLGLGFGYQVARNTVQLNRGNGHFSDVALYAEMFATDWSWSPLIADFNNDGYKDIHITNGIYKRPNDMDYIQYISNLEGFRFNPFNKDKIDNEMLSRMPTLQIPNEAFTYLGNNKWVSVTKDWGLDQASYSNGSAYGDLDNDGDLDLVVNNVNQVAFIYRNNIDHNNSDRNYLKVSFKGLGKNSLAIGTRVNLKSNGKVIANQLSASRGFQSSVEPVLTIGLGDLVDIDTMEVIWPNGKYQKFIKVKANQHLVLAEPEATEFQSFNASKKLLTNVAGIIKYRHEENTEYNDNNLEYLLPYRLSVMGPAMSVGDVNGDKLDDIFLGGASGQAGSIYLQLANGKFHKSNQPVFEKDRFFEDVKATFIDVDNDHDLDLIVLSGGYQYDEGNELLKDRLYLNNSGIFNRSIGLDQPGRNSSCIAISDFDKDGDEDIFIGVNAVRGKYGVPTDGMLLLNDGSGNYANKTIELMPDYIKVGMLTSAVWIDFDNDGDEDLALAGHWMPITIYVNENGVLSHSIVLNQSKGFWNKLVSVDIDGDGDLDLLAGNIGLNNKFKASVDNPLKLYVNDFDNNGTSDPIIMHYQSGRYLPMFNKDEIEKQVVVLKKKYTSYNDYANKVNSIYDLFEKENVNASTQNEINELRSICFINQGNGEFEAHPLPIPMQFSPINTFIVDDLNRDGILDIITSGNSYYMHVNLGRQDSDYGSVALGMGNGNFEYMNAGDTGMDIVGQVMESGQLMGGKQKYFVFGVNNDSVKVYSINYEK